MKTQILEKAISNLMEKDEQYNCNYFLSPDPETGAGPFAVIIFLDSCDIESAVDYLTEGFGTVFSFHKQSESVVTVWLPEQRAQNLNNNWECYDTGGHTLVYTPDVPLKTGLIVSLGVSMDAIALYPHKWSNTGEWDTGEYLFVWDYLDPSSSLMTQLENHLSPTYDTMQILDLMEDCFKIQQHLCA